MTPDDVRSDLQAWIDGALPPERATRVADAVATDPELAARAAELRAVDALLGRLPEERLDPVAVERLVARVEAQVRRPWWRRPVPWAVAAAAVLIGVLVFALDPEDGEDPAAALPALADYAVIVPPADEGQPAADAALAEMRAALEMSRFVESNYLPMG